MFIVTYFDGLVIRDQVTFIPVKEEHLVTFRHARKLLYLHSRQACRSSGKPPTVYHDFKFTSWLCSPHLV